MRKLRRKNLSAESLHVLDKMRELVEGHPSPPAQAKRLWDDKTNSNPRKKAFAEIRKVLGEMASGLDRCMYCEDSRGSDIDHYRPKSVYPSDTFRWDNYLLLCSTCNSKYKKDEFPVGESGEPLLLNPTTDEPAHHLELYPSNGKFRGKTARGRVTIDLLNLNGDRAEEMAETGCQKKGLPRGRSNALRILQALVLLHDAELQHGQLLEAERTRETILEATFSSLLLSLVCLVSKPQAAVLLKSGVPEALHRLIAEVPPEHREWIYAHRDAVKAQSGELGAS